MLTMRIVAFVLRALFASGADVHLALTDLPDHCRPYAAVPADVRDDTFGWNQLLSLASCLQDTSVTQVTREDQLEPMVQRYHDALYIPMLIYIGVLENGPEPMQLHAAYQVGMMHLMIVVRARRSIATPALDDELEPLLADSLRMAWLTFAVIARVADEDPSLVSDQVSRNEVRSARALLRMLPKPAGRHVVRGMQSARQGLRARHAPR